MSKIWDALRQAEQDKNRSVQTEDEETQHAQISGRSFTKCVLASAPVSVYGYGTTNKPFYEQSEAVSVNANGGMIVLAAAVNPGQTLLLTNEVNFREEKCVVREVSSDSCGTRIVFEFLRPAPDFWDSIQP